MSYQTDEAQLRLTNNTKAAVLGKVSLRIKIRNYAVAIPCYVTELCQDFDMILGNSIMLPNEAVMDFRRHTISLTKDGKLYTLHAGTDNTLPNDFDFDDEHVCNSMYSSRQFWNCAQASRTLKNGCAVVLVIINELSSAIASLWHRYLTFLIVRDCLIGALTMSYLCCLTLTLCLSACVVLRLLS